MTAAERTSFYYSNMRSHEQKHVIDTAEDQKKVCEYDNDSLYRTILAIFYDI